MILECPFSAFRFTAFKKLNMSYIEGCYHRTQKIALSPQKAKVKRRINVPSGMLHYLLHSFLPQVPLTHFRQNARNICKSSTETRIR